MISRSPCVSLGALAGAAILGQALVGCGPSQEQREAEARVQELEAENAAHEEAKRSMEEELDELRLANEAMKDRLEALGDDFQAAQGDREALQESLEGARAALEELRQREREAQERLRTFRQMLESFRSAIAAGRLRVRVVRNRMVVELPEGVLFDSGKARVKTQGRRALEEVAEVLAEIEGRDFMVAGHTDNVPISGRFRSNWELSTARAVNVVRLLVKDGVPEDRLSAAGFADTQPITSNDSPAGRALNRRIEIVLLPNLEELPDLSDLTAEPDAAPPPATEAPAGEGNDGDDA